MSRLPDPPIDIEFRDGVRAVPAYLIPLMSGLETYRMTYQEAINATHTKMASDHANKAMGKLIRSHFREWGT
jgi:hypothetical protein